MTVMVTASLTICLKRQDAQTKGHIPYRCKLRIPQLDCGEDAQ